MACYEPIQAFQCYNIRTEKDKPQIFFKREDVANYAYSSLELPCGRCLGCRYDQSKAWAVRCVHEAIMHARDGKPSCFLTLTFNDDALYSHRHNCSKCDFYKRQIKNEELKTLKDPTHERKIIRPCHRRSLCARDFTLFMKRLRKKTKCKIRYFHVGEYGSKLGRPHHHALIFGWQPDDMIYHDHDPNTGVTLYKSETLSGKEHNGKGGLWPYGFSTVGAVNWRTAAYCARYTIKKVYGSRAEGHYLYADEKTGECGPIAKEYITMSRRPGIAANWFRQYKGDPYPKDFITIDGRVFRVPRYYDKLLEDVDPELYKKIKRKRLTTARKIARDNDEPSRKSRRIVAERNLERLVRSYENES